MKKIQEGDDDDDGVDSCECRGNSGRGKLKNKGNKFMYSELIVHCFIKCLQVDILTVHLETLNWVF